MSGIREMLGKPVPIPVQVVDDEPDIFDDGTSIKPGERPEQEALESWPEDASKIMGKAATKFKKSDHNLRTRSLFEKEGWFVFRVDQSRTAHGGSIYTVDFLGLFDWMAIKPGVAAIGIQVCHKSGIGSHITKMTSTETTSFNKGRKIDNLMKWLECGFGAVLVGWDKVGSRWEPTRRELDLAEVEKALARKRKAV